MTKVALVSCVKSKQQAAAAAKDMYISTLFSGMRRYAQRHADTWYILSAEHGLLQSDQIISPYERTLNTMPKKERLAWAERVQHQLLEVLPAGASVAILAGKRYREHLIPFLENHHFSVNVPMHGLPFGRQLSWLNEH